MTQSHRSLPVQIFVVTILLGGLGALWLMGLQYPVPPLTPFLVWTLILLATESTGLDLPSGGFITVSGVVDFAGILCFGPLLVGWADVVSVLIFQGLWKKTPITKVAFNAGLYALTTAAAGSVYVLFGGRFGDTRFMHDLPALLAMGAVYFSVNSAAVSGVLALVERRNVLSVWKDNFRWGLLQHLSMLPLGMLLALFTLTGGLVAASLVVAPLSLARFSFAAYLRSRSDLKEFVRAISRVLDAVDPFTREHSLRVAGYAVRVARQQRLPIHEIEMIEYAALMHDLGKITSEARPLIEKPGLLTQDEKRVLNSHPTVGAALFEQVKSLRRAAEYVRAHHERLDGRGYPQALTAEKIPMGARILTVCDCFDAMTSDRPYVRARSPEEAVLELHRHSLTQFDPAVVETFVRLFEQGRLDDILRSPRRVPEPEFEPVAAPAREAAPYIPSHAAEPQPA